MARLPSTIEWHKGSVYPYAKPFLVWTIVLVVSWILKVSKSAVDSNIGALDGLVFRCHLNSGEKCPVSEWQKY